MACVRRINMSGPSLVACRGFGFAVLSVDIFGKGVLDADIRIRGDEPGWR